MVQFCRCHVPSKIDHSNSSLVHYLDVHCSLSFRPMTINWTNSLCFGTLVFNLLCLAIQTFFWFSRYWTYQMIKTGHKFVWFFNESRFQMSCKALGFDPNDILKGIDDNKPGLESNYLRA